MHFVSSFALLLPSLFFFMSATLAQSVITAEHSSSRAKHFTQLFDRSYDWLGADGIYSIPLDGNDNWGSADNTTKTLFVFSDSMLGTADPKTDKYNDVKMVNHSAALLTNYKALEMEQKSNIQFIFGKKGEGSRTNIFDKKYWLQDGIVIGKKLYLTGFVPGKNWKPTQIDLLTIPLLPSGMPNWQQITTFEHVPLLVENNHFLVMFGIGILDQIAQDGFVYIYGYKDNLKTNVKQLIVSRVKPGAYEKMDRWQFWNGKEWSSNIEDIYQDQSALADRVSTELSVTPIGQNQFLLVFVQDVMSGRVAYKIGSSPVGPFGKTVVFYEAPEPKGLGRGIYVYNAKAHPHLSSSEALLVSYNVNRLGSLPHNTNEYRPRFIELPMKKILKPLH